MDPHQNLRNKVPDNGNPSLSGNEGEMGDNRFIIVVRVLILALTLLGAIFVVSQCSRLSDNSKDVASKDRKDAPKNDAESITNSPDEQNINNKPKPKPKNDKIHSDESDKDRSSKDMPKPSESNDHPAIKKTRGKDISVDTEKKLEDIESSVNGLTFNNKDTTVYERIDTATFLYSKPLILFAESLITDSERLNDLSRIREDISSLRTSDYPPYFSARITSQMKANCEILLLILHKLDNAGDFRERANIIEEQLGQSWLSAYDAQLNFAKSELELLSMVKSMVNENASAYSYQENLRRQGVMARTAECQGKSIVQTLDIISIIDKRSAIRSKTDRIMKRYRNGIKDSDGVFFEIALQRETLAQLNVLMVELLLKENY